MHKFNMNFCVSCLYSWSDVWHLSQPFEWSVDTWDRALQNETHDTRASILNAVSEWCKGVSTVIRECGVMMGRGRQLGVWIRWFRWRRGVRPLVLQQQDHRNSTQASCRSPSAVPGRPLLHRIGSTGVTHFPLSSCVPFFYIIYVHVYTVAP